MRYLDTGCRDPQQSLAKWLKDALVEEISELRLQTGFFSLDGIGLFLPTLKASLKDDRLARILIGSNDGCTMRDHVAILIDLLGIPRKNASLGIVNFAGAYFHPKTYHIRRPDGTEAAFVGSANLTASGLALHVEAGISLDTRDGDPVAQVSQVAAAIDQWFEQKRDGLVLVDGSQALDELVENGLLALIPPPQPTQPVKKAGSTKSPRPHLAALVALPSMKGSKTPSVEPSLISEGQEAPEAAASQTASVQPTVAVLNVPSAPKQGFPQYFLFDKTTGQPTAGALALSGSQLPGGAVGLIVKLNKDSARQFAGKGGTANVSIPVATVSTLRFGIYGKYGRPRAEYELRLRYVGDGGTIHGGTTKTSVMGYGFTKNESGHRDIRMLVPSEVVNFGNVVKAKKMIAPTAGDLALLEWPTPAVPSYRLTFLQKGSAIAKQAAALFAAAAKSGQLVGKGACWLPAGLSPQ